MPQNNVLPDWRATYPNDAPVQKPPGVTVSTTATAPRVPNKFTYSAGTIQMVDVQTGEMKFLDPEMQALRQEHREERRDLREEHRQERQEVRKDDEPEEEVEEDEEEEEEESKPTSPRGRRR
jgi:hypothetical protein